MNKHLSHRALIFLYTLFYTMFVCSYNCLALKENESDESYAVSEYEVNYERLEEEQKAKEERKAKEELELVVEEIDEIEEPEVTYFNVPLEEDLQDHIFNLCEERDIEPAIVVSMIQRESRFREYVIGDNGRSYGLMQIQPTWHKARMDELDCSDLLDPYQNVTVGIDILGDLLEGGNSIEWALMAYNGGCAYANRKVSQGVVSDYVKDILKNSQVILKGEEL